MTALTSSLADAAGVGGRIEIVTVRSGDTVQSLARRMAFDTYQEDRFRAINGLDASGTLRAGDRVKIVTYAPR